MVTTRLSPSGPFQEIGGGAGVNCMSHATTQNNGTAATFDVFVPTNTADYAAALTGAGFTFTPLGSVWTWNGPGVVRFLVTVIASVLPNPAGSSSQVFVGIDHNSDVIGENSSSVFTPGVTNETFTSPDGSTRSVATSRIVELAPGDTVRPAFSASEVALFIFRQTMLLEQV